MGPITISEKILAIATKETNPMPKIIQMVSAAVSPDSDDGRQLSEQEISDIIAVIDDHVDNLEIIKNLLLDDKEVHIYNKYITRGKILQLASETVNTSMTIEESMCGTCNSNYSCKDYTEKLDTGYFKDQKEL